MTQPAVTFQIRQLEEYFNTRLFDRTHNRISLTEAGEKVYAYSERILGLYREMDNEIRTLTGEIIGVLVIGASTTVAEYLLPKLLGEFQVRFPKVKLRLRVSNSMGVVHMVENNDIDIGLVESPVGNKSLAVDVCWSDRLALIVPPDHELAGKESVHISELTRYPFVSREEGSGTRCVVSDYLEDNGMSMIDAAEKARKEKNALLPDLGFNAGLYLYTPWQVFYEMQPYYKGKFAAALDSLPDTETAGSFKGQPTPLVEGLEKLDPILS